MKRSVLVLAVAIVLVVAVLLLRKSEGPGQAITSAPPPEVGVLLDGINIGHWLSDELQYGAERYACERPTAFESLRARFGVEEADRLLESYRDSFITASDIAAIKKTGFKTLRLPVSAALLYDRPGDTSRFARAAARIEWLCSEAEKNGMTVILNLRVRAGEWAPQPPMNGKRFPAIWSNRDVEEVARLWQALASRFRDTPALAAYDLSPGPCQAEVDWNAALMAWSRAIKASDVDRIVYAPWRRPAVERIAADAELSAMKLGFAADFLTSEMTGPHSNDVARTSLEQDLPRMNSFWKAQNFERLAVAYNPILSDPAGSGFVTAYGQAFRASGWGSMLWTYKTIHWTGSDARNASAVSCVSGLAQPDLEEGTLESVQQFVEALKSASAEEDATMKLALSSPSPIQPQEREHPVAAAPGDAAGIPAGWLVTAMGAAETTVRSASNGAMLVTSSGLGPDCATPEFAFVHREPDGAIDFSAVLVDADLKSSTAGAGLMVRERMDESSPYLLVYRGVDGSIRSVSDNKNGQPPVRRKLMDATDSTHLRVLSDGAVIKASCSPDGAAWPVAENFSAPWLTNKVSVGCVVFSGHEYRTTEALFRDLNFKTSGDL